MSRFVKCLYALLLLSCLIPTTAFAKPLLGFGVAVATNGFLSSKLAEVKVASVQVGSPSERAGLQVGDLIVEMNGKAIKGANGPAMRKTLVSIKSGEVLKLKVLRAGKGVFALEIVAGS